MSAPDTRPGAPATSTAAGKALAAWILVLMLAIANGALREGVLVGLLGPVSAQICSGLLLCALVLCAAWFLAAWIGQASAAQYWLAGGLWLILTLGFEFSFGMLVQGKTWPVLLEAYTFKGGNLWPLVVAVTLAGPRLAAWLRSRVGRSAPQ